MIMNKMVYNENFGFYESPKETIHFDFPIPSPEILDGADLYDVACPINPMTGHRDNPLTILKYALGPQNQAILDKLLQEIPTVQEIDAPDDFKLETLFGRLDTGTFAERDRLFKRLDSIKGILFPSSVEVPSDKIDFSDTVEPSTSES
jgi:hypothetical protein